MRGRKPSLKLVEASPNAADLPSFPPPSQVPPGMRPEWQRVCDDLAARGLLSEITLPLVTSYVLAIWQVALCVRAIKRDGSFVKGRAGEIRVHPAQQLMSKSHELIVRLGSELGLSPTARARAHFKATPETKGGADDWSDMDL
jgi:P27 family predicted phage terminase small subunit